MITARGRLLIQPDALPFAHSLLTKPRSPPNRASAGRAAGLAQTPYCISRLHARPGASAPMDYPDWRVPQPWPAPRSSPSSRARPAAVCLAPCRETHTSAPPMASAATAFLRARARRHKANTKTFPTHHARHSLQLSGRFRETTSLHALHLLLHGGFCQKDPITRPGIICRRTPSSTLAASPRTPPSHSPALLCLRPRLPGTAQATHARRGRSNSLMPCPTSRLLCHTHPVPHGALV